jgi:hypothetical protein
MAINRANLETEEALNIMRQGLIVPATVRRFVEQLPIEDLAQLIDDVAIVSQFAEYERIKRYRAETEGK